MRSHNHIGKYRCKVIGGVVRMLASSACVASSFQSRTVCDQHESLYKGWISGYPLHLHYSQNKWTCSWSVTSWKRAIDGAIESSNFRSGVSKVDKTWILQNYDCTNHGTGQPRKARKRIFEEGILHAGSRNLWTSVLMLSFAGRFYVILLFYFYYLSSKTFYTAFCVVTLLSSCLFIPLGIRFSM